ncbi:MAG: hypothetical protein ACRBFS_06800 [Aureispira sp.]
MYNSYPTTNSASRVMSVPMDRRDNTAASVEKNGLGVVGYQRQQRIPTAPFTVVYLGRRF